MTNYEMYKDEIISIIAGFISVNKHTMEPSNCSCRDISCNECLFVNKRCSNGEGAREWLNAEYTEQPKNAIEVATLISFLKQEPNQMKRVKTIAIVDGVPVINGGE